MWLTPNSTARSMVVLDEVVVVSGGCVVVDVWVGDGDSGFAWCYVDVVVVFVP